MIRPLVILDTPSDWKYWYMIIKDKAERQDIWNLCDPDLPTEPIIPVEPSFPSASEIKPGATSLVQLDSTEMAKFQALKEEYKNNQRRYETKITKINSLHDLLMSTVAPHNLIFIENQKTLYGKLSALKMRLAPTDRARKMALRAKYNKLKIVRKTQDIQKWMQEWVRVVTEGKTLNIAEIQDSRPLHDFLTAVEQIDASFAHSRQAIIEEKELAGEPLPDIYALINDFEYHRLIRQSTNPTT